MDFLPSFLAGGVGFTVFIITHKMAKIKFFAEILSSTLIGLLAYFLVNVGLGSSLDKIIIGSVMPLVPGVLITNAVRDLMAGDLVSGLARGAEGLFTSLGLGVGIAVVIALFG